MPRLSRKQLVTHLHRRLRWVDLDPAYLRRLVALARAEDLAGAGLRRAPRRTGDVTTLGQRLTGRGTADLVAREELVVCGLGIIPLVLAAYGRGCTVKPRVRDGARVPPGTVVATLSGPSRVLLPAERPLLNFLQRLSGIATTTRRYVDALGSSRTRLLDTRKTTPGWRMLEKYAVACGGSCNHRLGLFDRVMLKDNHLAAAGATAGERLAAAVRRARAAAPDLPIEVEVDSLVQIPPVLEAGADIILLDNFTVPQLREAITLIGGRAFTEASGGVNLRTIPDLAGLGLDFISTGALVHHSVWIDIGLDWRE
ncbi:MAG TPA: carboxylating nicotinate-nucleotide diphosphorylase [Opitutaceae bacterium]|nr:carboxylating nicotinate-nucleotide diphosphorylase [Opitutaceae bacterium]